MRRAIKVLFWIGAYVFLIVFGFIAASNYTGYIRQAAFNKGVKFGEQYARAGAKAYYISEMKSACVGWWDDTRDAKDNAPILCRRRPWME